ncbi:TorD/DmsD family molecular chaperone [Thermoflexus hugenholtzii]
MEEAIPLSEATRLRHALYRFFAASFLYPQRDRLEQLEEAVEVLEACTPWLCRFAFYEPWRRWAERFLERAKQPWGLELAYTDLFGLLPPQASVYLDPDGLMRGRLISELEAIYRGMGLAPSGACPMPPDHLAVELEFMAFLCQREASVWQGGSLDLHLLSLERWFLSRHLRRWLARFARDVRRQDPDNPYRDAVEAVEAFVVHDADWVAEILRHATNGGLPDGPARSG